MITAFLMSLSLPNFVNAKVNTNVNVDDIGVDDIDVDVRSPSMSTSKVNVTINVDIVNDVDADLDVYLASLRQYVELTNILLTTTL